MIATGANIGLWIWSWRGLGHFQLKWKIHPLNIRSSVEVSPVFSLRKSGCSSFPEAKVHSGVISIRSYGSRNLIHANSVVLPEVLWSSKELLFWSPKWSMKSNHFAPVTSFPRSFRGRSALIFGEGSKCRSNCPRMFRWVNILALHVVGGDILIGVHTLSQLQGLTKLLAFSSTNVRNVSHAATKFGKH